MIAADHDRVRQRRSADEVQTRRRAEAADAWHRGREALNRGDLAIARFWLERVGRIAPEDPRPRYELALVLAATDDPAADDALLAIATGHDLASAWLTLARLRWRNRRYKPAAEALASLLRRFDVPTDPDFPEFADRAAAAAEYPGWCGVSGGAVTLHPLDATLQQSATRIAATVAGAPLLGSPLDLCLLRRIRGIVTSDGHDITGWVGNPSAPDTVPALRLVDRDGTVRPIRPRRVLDPDAPAWFLPRHAFRVRAAVLRGLRPPFRILGPDRQLLSGCPIDPAEIAALAPPRAAGTLPVLPARARLCVVMPVYRDAATTLAALRSLYAAIGDDIPIVVIDDASPEPDLARAMTDEARAGRIRLRRHRCNRGFPGAANAGIAQARRLAPGCDILLLNADILLPPGAPSRLHAALYAAPDIASATPFSNEATILSYPMRQGGNPAPDLGATIRRDRLAQRANRASVIDIPTAIGFCMAMRHDAMRAIGGFDATLFAQGYGEENDWCLRAAARGFRHVAVPGVFVAHHANVSFGATGSALCARNLVLLERRHPGYHAAIAAHHAADPLRLARFRLDRARFRAGRHQTGAVVLVSHDHGGGIARVIDARMAALRDQGIRPILIQPDFSDQVSHADFIGAARLTDGAPMDYPNLCYDLAREASGMLALLRAERVRHVEVHHTLGHHPAIRGLAAALGVPEDHVVHDYSSFCKRVNLLGPGFRGDARRYCGEPDIAGCVACIDQAGSALTDPIAPAALVARSMGELRAARRVFAPSGDAAARLRRHFPGIAVTVTPWQDDRGPVSLRPPPASGPRIVAVAGAIGPAKGFDVLLACARDAAARDLALSFIVIGTSEDDAILIETGRVMITGAYQEGEATALIARSGAHLGFLPSIWPETWCFALSEMWRAGLYGIGFDLGAQAARITATGRGFLLPLGLPADRINRTLLAWRPDLGDLNNRIQPLISKPAAPAPSTS